MTKVTKQPVVKSNFTKKVLAELNKTEAQKQMEGVEEFRETSVIACQTQITLIESSEIPTLKMKLKAAENKLEKQQKAYEKSRFSTAYNFETYVQNRENALDGVESAQQEIDSLNSQIEAANNKLNSFKEILTDLQ